MTRYQNGQIPMSALVSRGTGTNSDGYWEHRMSAATARKWDNLVRDVQINEGKTLSITPGWNAYRPIDAQWTAYNNSAPGIAAYPGTSSHGGTYAGKDSLAIDVGNFGVIGRDKFFAYARKHGFTAGYFNGVTGPDEPWHIIDFDPWGAIPAALEEDDMTPEQDNRLKAIENLLRVGNANYGYPQATKQDTEDIRNRIYVKDANGNVLWDVFQELRNRLTAIENKLK